MTFVEFIVLVLVVGLLCFLMLPLQKYLEVRLYRFFRSKSKHSGKTVIDVTDYTKKRK